QPLTLTGPHLDARSLWAVGSRMARDEGLMSLMKGTSASAAREGTYSTTRLGTYEVFKDELKERTRETFDPEGLPLKVTASVIAGTIGSAIANPTDLVKIRMQAYYPPATYPYHSMRHAFSSIYNEASHNGQPPSVIAGLRFLYRGVFPTVIRGWTVAASQMPAYDHTKQVLKSKQLVREGWLAHFVCSSIAGLVVSLASNPVDVIKVRLMNDSMGLYNRSILACVNSILCHEGPLALYKGFTMCWARLGTHTVVTYMIYEQIRLVRLIP
ncbi:mitochondrial carrier domain-containing protein, partial [Cantharellus anzutake]|uniref:mitochondrial carrier domain-containing protein n=1 Tax=Cantharellus anzutake TaxID=1750568 RepID=UPI001906BE02